VSLLFVFDMDNVLYDYNWKARMAALEVATGIPFDTLRERWWLESAGERSAEAGAFRDADEYFAAFRRAVGTEISEEEWLAARADAMTPLPESIAAAARAAELGQVSLLTNNNPLIERHLPRVAAELVPIFGDHLRSSSFYGARKPDALVFERLLEAYSTDAANAFFTDDLEENIAGARSVGITSHLFTGDAGAMLGAIEEFAESRG